MTRAWTQSKAIEKNVPLATWDIWRRELLSEHWLPQILGPKHPICRSLNNAAPFALSAELSLPLLGAMTRGMGQAYEHYFTGNESALGTPGCVCFFPEDGAGFDANMPFEDTWFETPEIEGCQWGMLTSRLPRLGRTEFGGMHVTFARLPQLDDVLVFFGSWHIPPICTRWKVGRLSEAEFAEALHWGEPVVSSWSRMIDAPKDFDWIWASALDRGAGYPPEFGAGPRAILDESIGNQFTTMFLIAQGVINQGHAATPRM